MKGFSEYFYHEVKTVIDDFELYYFNSGDKRVVRYMNYLKKKIADEAKGYGGGVGGGLVKRPVASLESVQQARRFKGVASFLHGFNLETTKRIPEDLDSEEDKIKYDTYINYTGKSVDPTRPHGQLFRRGRTSEDIIRFCGEHFLKTHTFSDNNYMKVVFDLYDIRGSIRSIKFYLVDGKRNDGKRLSKDDKIKLKKVLRGLELYVHGVENELDEDQHYKKESMASNLTIKYVKQCHAQTVKAMLWIEDIIGDDAYIKGVRKLYTKTRTQVIWSI